MDDYGNMTTEDAEVLKEWGRNYKEADPELLRLLAEDYTGQALRLEETKTGRNLYST